MASAMLVALWLSPQFVNAQTSSQDTLAEKVEQLTEAMAKTQAQLEQSQSELETMRRQLTDLKRLMAQGGPSAATPPEPSSAADSSLSGQTETPETTAAAVRDLQDRVAVEESQIATQDQAKIESVSKFPVKVTGLLLMNGFKNSGAVDTPASPSVAIGGSGSAGVSVRQTILGIEARGPHIFRASSFADLQVDFFGSPATNSSTGSYPGYNVNYPLIRLRTVHAGLYWNRTQVYFALDRPIISPDTPTSLTATAVPALAWSGNLWTWNPQAVLTQDFSRSGSSGFEMQGALVDVADAPLTPAFTSPLTALAGGPSSAEQSSEPGVEGRFAFFGPDRGDGHSHIGVGGYFAPHTSSLGRNFDSWASTLDVRVPLVAKLELSGSFYRGAALGGLGGGGYKDFAYKPNPATGGYFFRPLDDVGGWAQLKEKVDERLQFNAAFGMDQVFASTLEHYYVSNGSMVQNLARNRTFTGNVIFSPSAYLLFSLEYRHLDSDPIEGGGNQSNIIGIGAGYKF